MSYDTRHDDRAQPREGAPAPDATREDARREYEPPAGEYGRDEEIEAGEYARDQRPDDDQRPDYDEPMAERAPAERPLDHEAPVEEQAIGQRPPEYGTPEYGTPVDGQAADRRGTDFAAPVDEAAPVDAATPVDEPAREAASPRAEPPAWHEAETADRPVPGGPSDLDTAEPVPASAEAGVVTPAGTAAPPQATDNGAAPQAVDTGAPAAAVGFAAVEPPDDTVTVWSEDAVHDYQQRWREVQLRFVDDPRAAADEAQQLVSEALDRFAEAVTARKGELDGWQGGDGADTEQMRTVVRRYRKLLDRLLEV